MKNKKLAITFTEITNEQLQKIKEIASEYEVSQMPANAVQICESNIVFGNIKPEFIAKAPHLTWLHAHFAGVDSLLKPEVNFPEKVMLTNSAGTYGIAISEHLLTTTLMLMRRNIEYAKRQFQNQWQPLGEVKSIYGSKICVVGLGDIGENYAKRCQALGASVTGVVRTKRAIKPTTVDELYTIDQLDEAIANQDVVALALPETKETIGLFNEARLNKMKTGALLLNVGRGTAIDTNALIRALTAGQIGGAGLDVTNPEPLPHTSPLWQMDNVIITPHISGNQTLKLTNELIVDKFIKYLQNYIANQPFAKLVDKQLGY